MFSISNSCAIKTCNKMEQSNVNTISAAEEGGRGCRSKRKQIDPAYCPVCSVTLRISELETHLVTEIDKLSKLSVRNKRNQKWTSNNGGLLSFPNNSLTKGYETYQKVKMNRQVRLKIKSRKRKNDEITCPVCNKIINEDITIHVEMCLQQVDKTNEVGSEDENIDVESFEEYEWAGQTRVRASSLLEGGFSGLGLGTSVIKSLQEDEDGDINVDSDDSHMYGSAQYTDNDISGNMHEVSEVNEGELDGKHYEDNNQENIVNNVSKTITNNDTLSSASSTVLEALKFKIHELEAREQNKELYKCLICMGIYKNPVVSICCWHVHCEHCWLKTLATKKLCPQCNMITSPLDLRKIYV